MKEQTASKVPQIRFKGFEDEWEDKPIGEVLSEKKRPIVLKDHQRYELITVKRRNEGIVSRGHLFGRDISVKNYSQLQTGDFVISKRQIVHGATGMIPSKLDGAIVSNEYLVAVNSSKLLTEFLTIISSLPDMRQKFFLSSYGVDIEKLFFDAEDWKKRNVTIPDVTEQTQIGGYFRELDSLIGLHQRKHDKLVTLKKAMLQKMFPQPGATTPEIRFKGFSGEWVENKLGEVMAVGSVKRIHQSDWTKAGVRFLRARDIVSAYKNEDPADILYISQAKYDEYSLLSGKVELGDLLVTGVGTIGIPYLIRKNDPVYFKDGNIIWFKNHGALNGDFLYYSFVGERIQNYIKESAGTGTVGTYTISCGKDTPFASPLSDEQQKIGTYFRTLDELISQHAIQLQKLQQIKSACLKKMFV
ncbi:MAG: restriction endonuclease subunit S [Rhodocyclaceae bacterium]|nr:restriction endonuclease subunit S [Rhodocyclaceae bacterium]